jgi:stalled ribosome rescue protein Dom34
VEEIAGVRRGKIMDIITQALLVIKIVEEMFKRIQENPALYGAENGLTSHEMEILEKLISLISEANIAADAICKRALNGKY